MKIRIRRAAATTIAAFSVLAGSFITAETAHAASGATTAPVNVRSGPGTSNDVLTFIPGNIAVDIQCQAKGERVIGTYDTDWWARVSYNGKTGYATRAYITAYTSDIPVCDTAPSAPSPITVDVAGLFTQPTVQSHRLTRIPKDTRLTIHCQAKGDAVRGVYNTDWWAKVTYDGKTGYASRAFIKVPAGVKVDTCANSSATPAPPKSAVDGPISRAEVRDRAMFWVNQRVPYSMTGWRGDVDGRAYRTDCSGMVSMAFHLGSSLNTESLLTSGTVREISKDELQPGDIVGNLGYGTLGAAGHVVIFDGWTDASRTSFYTLEQTWPGGAQRLTRTWGTTFFTQHAYRYINIR